MKTYQTHSADTHGMSDTAKKLQTVQLPKDMAGMRVLDIGCNEGFFCNVAAERGAARIVGIDLLESNISFAKKRYGSNSIEFIVQGWNHLPDEEFDLVLWLSAMHYERNPRSVIEQIASRLSNKGVFILEAGVINTSGKVVRSVSRYGDNLVYPTMDYLKNVLLEGLSYKWMAGGYKVEGDPVPRHVFHCMKRKRTVIFVVGGSKSGKTYLANTMLSAGADKIISVDDVLVDIGHAQYHHGEFEKYVRSVIDTNNLGALYEQIEGSDRLKKDFAKWIGSLVYDNDQCIVIEGNVLGQTRNAIKELLSETVFWEISRV